MTKNHQELKTENLVPFCESCGEPMVVHNDRWWCPECLPDNPPAARPVRDPEPEDVGNLACPACGSEVRRYGPEVICRRGKHRLRWDGRKWLDGSSRSVQEPLHNGPLWPGEDDGGGFSPSSDHTLGGYK